MPVRSGFRVTVTIARATCPVGISGTSQVTSSHAHSTMAGQVTCAHSTRSSYVRPLNRVKLRAGYSGSTGSVISLSLSTSRRIQTTRTRAQSSESDAGQPQRPSTACTSRDSSRRQLSSLPTRWARANRPTTRCLAAGPAQPDRRGQQATGRPHAVLPGA